MANQYGRWYVHNDPQTWRQGMGAYNRPFKERYQRPPEYTPSIEAYRHYPAIKNIIEEQEKKKAQEQNKNDASNKLKRNQQGRNARSGRSVGKNIVKNIAGKAVAIVGGGAIVVAGYQAIEAEAAKTPIDEPAIVVEMTQAEWENWNSADTTVMLKLYDSDGNLIKEIPAYVSLNEVAPTCTEYGRKIYTATGEDNGTTYSDTHTETADSPTGHEFGAPEKTVMDGKDAYVFECSHCHETFVITPSIEEEE